VDVPYPKRTLWQRLRSVELVRAAVDRREQNYFALHEALVDHFQSQVNRLGASPVILFLPGRSDTEIDRERRATLRRWAAARRIPFRDLTELLHMTSMTVAETHLADDWHWNERGHRLAGEALHSLLATEVLRDAGAEIDPRTLPAPPWRRGRWNYCSDGSGDRTARLIGPAALVAPGHASAVSSGTAP
jgi:hypothetical protein